MNSNRLRDAFIDACLWLCITHMAWRDVWYARWAVTAVAGMHVLIFIGAWCGRQSRRTTTTTTAFGGTVTVEDDPGPAPEEITLDLQQDLRNREDSACEPTDPS